MLLLFLMLSWEILGNPTVGKAYMAAGAVWPSWLDLLACRYFHVFLVLCVGDLLETLFFFRIVAAMYRTFAGQARPP